MRVGVAALQAILAATDVLGRAAHRVRPVRPAAADVAALFSDASPARAAAIAHAMSGTRYQNRALVEIARRRGLGILQDLVDPASVEGLRPFVGGAPAIFVCWHVGPPFGLAGALEAVGLHLLLLRRTLDYGTTPTLEVAAVDDGAARRAAFRQALARLRAGGSVLIPLDAPDAAQTAPVPCFGRARPMARGAFAMSRLTGAPVVPLVTRLDADRMVRVAIGSPLAGTRDTGDADAFETALAAGAAAWLEAYVRASPAQLRRCSLQWLLEAPRIA